jgi:DNA-binding MarR family transcriptional regulator
MPGIRDIWFYANNILRSARQMVNEELKPMNLSSAEGNILIQLITQEPVIRQDVIVELLDISKPAVSRALESLENKGYITRERDPFDKRVKWVMLTEKAHEISPRVEIVYSEVFSTAAQVATEQEIEFFIELFRRVSDSFSEARAKRKKQGDLQNAK